MLYNETDIKTALAYLNHINKLMGYDYEPVTEISPEHPLLEFLGQHRQDAYAEGFRKGLWSNID